VVFCAHAGRRRAKVEITSDNCCLGSGINFDCIHVECLTQILSFLDLPDRLQLATVSTEFAEAVGRGIGGVAVDLRKKSRAVGGRLLTGPSVNAVTLVSGGACDGTSEDTAAAAAAAATRWDPQEQKLWPSGPGARLKPAAAAPHLRRIAAALTAQRTLAPAPRPAPRALSLALVAPEMDATASELQRLLATAGAEGVFAAISVPQGLTRLDGALAAHLARCNSPASSLPTGLQVRPPAPVFLLPCTTAARAGSQRGPLGRS
jgi:hypothetical protein